MTTKFSRQHVLSCSGQASGDVDCVQQFCREAIFRAKGAEYLLKQIADHEATSSNIVAEVESAMVQIEGLFDSVNEFELFFDSKANMRAPFTQAKTEIDSIRNDAIESYRKIARWIKNARKLL